MKDNEYFNKKLYCAASEELKSLAKDLAKKEGTHIHYIVDEGLRKVLAERNIELPTEPKKPVLV